MWVQKQMRKKYALAQGKSVETMLQSIVEAMDRFYAETGDAVATKVLADRAVDKWVEAYLKPKPRSKAAKAGK